MWIGVTERFMRFDVGITPTTDQLNDGIRSVVGITSALNRNYHGSSEVQGSWFFAGSWGKGTNRFPFNDADVFFVLPVEVYHRVERVAGNKQSYLLQEVKNVLAATYPQTDMRGDGQVVQIRFNHLLVEVVPSFKLTDGRYFICDTNAGGRWKTADPMSEIAAIQTADAAASYNARRTIRMAKAWKDECGVPLPSYLLETLLSNFMTTYVWRGMGYYYYDWTFRDFLAELRTKANTYLTVPDGSVVFLGSEWLSRTETAYGRALKACDYEREDLTVHAGEEWQKIFGDRIPIHV